jgi:hypothetical protein
MALTLSAGDLPGIAIREGIGERIIDFSESFDTEEDGDGNILSRLWNLGKSVVGFVVKNVIGFILKVFNFQALWSRIVQNVQFAINFDFGTSDAALEAQLKGQWDAYAAQLGGVVGNSLGWVLCGVIPGAFLVKFNAVMGARVLKEVGEEALDEISANINFLAQTGTRNLTRAGFIRQFKNLRRWLNDPTHPLYYLLPESLRQAWATGKSWTIAQQIENRIESIENQAWQNFVEEFWEETGDACIEAGYVVAGALDTFIAEQRQAKAEQVLEVTPNREYPREKFILAGPENELRSTLPLAIANYELLDQRDVGVVSALDPSHLFVKAMPLELYCKIEFRSDRGNEGPRPSYQISSVKRSRIDDYAFIRQICGGANGYQWGRWKAIATMSDGHTITSYAATEGLAKDRVRDLAQLSDAEILTINVTHELKEDKRLLIPGLQRDSEQVRPYRIIITNRRYFSTPRPGSKPSKRGYWVPVSARLSISGATKPPDWDARVAEILLGPVGGVGDI